MKNFKEFSADIDLELDEMDEDDSSVTLQVEYKDVVVYDYYAERYAEYLNDHQVERTFIGVENSEEQLSMIEIRNGEVLYSSQNPLEGFRTKIIP